MRTAQLARLTLGMAEDYYHEGRISQVEYEALPASMGGRWWDSLWLPPCRGLGQAERGSGRGGACGGTRERGSLEEDRTMRTYSIHHSHRRDRWDVWEKSPDAFSVRRGSHSSKGSAAIHCADLEQREALRMARLTRR